MHLFSEDSLEKYLTDHREAAASEIRHEDKNQILSIDEEDYVSYILSKYIVQPLEFYPEQIRVSESEKMVPAAHFPGHYNTVPGKSYLKHVVKFHLPYSGDRRLPMLEPNPHLTANMKATLTEDEIEFEIVNWNDDQSTIKKCLEESISYLRKQATYTNKLVEMHNAHINQTVPRAVQERKSKLLAQANLVANLGIPVFRKNNLPPTFNIPAVRKKVIVQKPKPSSEIFSPEPTISDKTYYEILKTCEAIGSEMEKHPSTFNGKNEEALRDNFLLVLTPNFESVTAETFNKSGKTDILIKHEGKNAFIAECKFWGGESQHLKTIDQILKYLTWRDSKSAIIYFVDNKKIAPALKQVVEATMKHHCFKKTKEPTSESWFNFDFHFPNDPNRKIRLAMLFFHFPQ